VMSIQLLRYPVFLRFTLSNRSFSAKQFGRAGKLGQPGTDRTENEETGQKGRLKPKTCEISGLSDGNQSVQLRLPADRVRARERISQALIRCYYINKLSFLPLKTTAKTLSTQINAACLVRFGAKHPLIEERGKVFQVNTAIFVEVHGGIAPGAAIVLGDRDNSASRKRHVRICSITGITDHARMRVRFHNRVIYRADGNASRRIPGGYREDQLVFIKAQLGRIHRKINGDVTGRLHENQWCRSRLLRSPRCCRTIPSPSTDSCDSPYRNIR